MSTEVQVIKDSSPLIPVPVTTPEKKSFVSDTALKAIILTVFIFQNVACSVLLRKNGLYSQANNIIANKVAPGLILSESLKLLCSIFFTFRERKVAEKGGKEYDNELLHYKHRNIWIVLCCGLVFALQNTLNAIAQGSLTPAVYQVSYQIRIPLTAVLSILILKRYISFPRKLSLLVVFLGVVATNLTNGKPAGNPSSNDAIQLGLICLLISSVTSSITSVMLEGVFKKNVSFWLINVYMASVGVLFNVCRVFTILPFVKEHGLFGGFTYITYSAFIVQAVGGILIGLVMKKADNIIKCLATSIATIISCLVSYYYLHDFQPTIYFAIAASFVVGAAAYFVLSSSRDKREPEPAKVTEKC